jgi:hypothetical protein
MNSLRPNYSALLAGGVILVLLVGCDEIELDIDSKLKQWRDECAVPAAECTGSLGQGLACPQTVEKALNACTRSQTASGDFEIKVAGVLTAEGEGTGSLKLTADPRIAEHSHRRGEGGPTCAAQYVAREVRYSEEGELAAKAGASIELASGKVTTSFKHGPNSGARCATEPHGAPRECGRE